VENINLTLYIISKDLVPIEERFLIFKLLMKLRMIIVLKVRNRCIEEIRKE
jgi:hypothetical protein